MIMPNNTTFSSNEKDEGLRRFNNILRMAAPLWGEIFYDCSSKIARGVLATESRGTYIGELSYDEIKNHLFLSVRIAAPNAFALARMEAFQRFTNNRVGLGHITLDREDRIVNVRAATAISESATRHAVESIFADAFDLLEDEDLHHLLT